MPRFSTAGLLSIPDYNTSLLCSQPPLLPTLFFFFSHLLHLLSTHACWHNSNDVTDFCLPFSICLPYLLPHYHPYKFGCAQCCQLGSCIFIQPPHISFVSSLFLHTASVNGCPYRTNHGARCEPLKTYWRWKLLLKKNPSKFFYFRKDNEKLFLI